MSGRLLVLVVACAFAVVAPAASAQQPTDPQEPKVDELLEEFPIGTETVTTEVDASAPPPGITVVPQEDPGSNVAQVALAVAVVAAVLLLVLGAGVLVLRRRESPQPAPAIWSETANLELLYQALASENREWDNLQPAAIPTRRSASVTDLTQGQKESQPGKPETTSESLLDHGDVVARISEILKSAESAAEAIRAEAVAKAQEIARGAEQQGQSLLSKAKEEAARIRTEAQEAAKEAKSAADSYGARQRREAEERVQQILGQAEAQARATRQAAEEMARQIEAAAREREEQLNAQMRPLEANLRRALDGFRGITAQLEELLDTRPKPAGGDETLVEALSGPVKRAGEWEETPPPPQQQERPSDG
jgi:hypothetical protein